MRLTALVCACLLIAFVSPAKSNDGNVPDPFCNVRVAHIRRYGTSTRTPKDIRRMMTRLTKNGIRNEGALLSAGAGPYGPGLVDWWITVYPPDAAKARHLVESANGQDGTSSLIILHRSQSSNSALA